MSCWCRICPPAMEYILLYCLEQRQSVALKCTTGKRSEYPHTAVGLVTMYVSSSGTSPSDEMSCHRPHRACPKRSIGDRDAWPRRIVTWALQEYQAHQAHQAHQACTHATVHGCSGRSGPTMTAKFHAKFIHCIARESRSCFRCCGVQPVAWRSG
jgi:hypothetical protein